MTLNLILRPNDADGAKCCIDRIDRRWEVMGVLSIYNDTNRDVVMSSKATLVVIRNAAVIPYKHFLL